MTKEELEKENAELDCQKNRNKFCYSCANATEKCFKNEIGCPCDKYKSYKDENVELKDDNKVMADNYSKMEQKFYDNLTKAKDLLAKWVELFKPKSETALPTPIQFDTEQFLNSEVEK